jgi:Glycosyl transferase family 2
MRAAATASRDVARCAEEALGPISPELVLVDPELADRARSTLDTPGAGCGVQISLHTAQGHQPSGDRCRFLEVEPATSTSRLLTSRSNAQPDGINESPPQVQTRTRGRAFVLLGVGAAVAFAWPPHGGFDQLLGSALLFSSLAFGMAVVLTVLAGALDFTFRLPASLSTLDPIGVFLLVPLLASSNRSLALLPLLVVPTFVLASSRMLRDFSVPGRLLLATQAQLLLAGLAWGSHFLITLPVSSLTRGLLLAGSLLFLLLLPASLVQVFESWEVFCRERWQRPRVCPPPMARTRYPKVSLHVPAHAEPPDLVIATLDSLARLRYPNFEVLVIDNNTTDPALWRPVEEHCRLLGERFRFLHVEGLAGAKAGALNLALEHTATDAEVIGVVDADYHVREDFLEKLVGAFDDASLGFVQPPHDYRGWQHSRYLRMCYWEYKYFFHTNLVSLNERDAALTVGTMCLIRRQALEEAGGWAEWCLTEDSELAIRIHALGYSSIYLTETFGRGLIPETFAGYKRQRHRWTYGPVQELKHHFRLLLPNRLAPASELSPAQKIHHFNHGLDRAAIGLSLLLTPLGVAAAISMVAHREVIPIPTVLWVSCTILACSALILRWFVYCKVIGCSTIDALGAGLATKALGHTVTMASLRALLSVKARWLRTSKFSPRPSSRRALVSTRAELAFAAATLAITGSLVVALPRSGFVLFLAIGGLLQAGRYLTSPLVALIAERELQRQTTAAT